MVLERGYMIPKYNVFMVMTDYQLIIALSWCNESHKNEMNYILFLHRKTSLINYINLESKHIRIFPINASENYFKPVIISGIINELKRLINHHKCKSILKKTKIERIYLSIEEEHFLATVGWLIKSNKNIKIFHIEEGNVVYDEQSYILASEINITWWFRLLKYARAKLRILYFGKNHLKFHIKDTYGRATFYECAVVLLNKDLSSKLAGKNHIQINKSIFLHTLLELFDFDSSLTSIISENNKILLIISDGEANTNPFDAQKYCEILIAIKQYATSKGYVVFLKNHPLYSGYLDRSDITISIINEDLPAEFYFIKWMNQIVVIGGNSTSLGVSVTLGIPTYSFIDIYNDHATKGSGTLNNRTFLESHNVNILSEIKELVL